MISKIKKILQKQGKTLLSLSDVPSISIIGKVTNINIKSIVEYRYNQQADIEYIIFAGVYIKSKQDILYILVNDQIKQTSLKNLVIKVSFLKKDFLFQQYSKASSSSLKNAKDLYSNNRVMDESQCIQYFNNILMEAIEFKTSDIHISVRFKEATVKLRINGDLFEVQHYTYDDMLRIISSVYNKFASKDSKDEHFDAKQTHETSIRRDINGKNYNLRFISKPTSPSGSFNVTIRIIDESFDFNIDSLGYAKYQLKVLKENINHPYGLIVLAGQVGSGKSATIQSLANFYIKKATIDNNLTKKLVTFESPVEYPILGAEQIEYKRNPKNTIEQERNNLQSQIQSLLRMDSDACVLQEIRSKTTGELALELVQSNNLVFTTVHAQSAVGIFQRFKGLGMDVDYLTEPNCLLALVYQTLIKTPCDKCYKVLDSNEFNELKLKLQSICKNYDLDEKLLQKVRIINPTGCKCCNKGVLGRTIVGEVVKPNLELLEAFSNNDHMAVHLAFRKNKGITQREHAISKILQGQICPLDYENKVSSLLGNNIYDKIDIAFYKNVFQDFMWED